MSNMYPDLNDDNQDKSNFAGEDQTPQTYNSTSAAKKKAAEKKKQQQKKNGEKDTCCVLGAKIWVSIIGIIAFIVGLFTVIVSLYAKFGYSGYASLSATLPTGGIWMIFAFGLILAIFSIILILSACFYQNGCFKVILVVFAIILAILLILEVISASIVVWGLGIIAIPETSVGNAAADQLLQARSTAANGTWATCCVDNHPPYNAVNVSTIDSACLWPEEAQAVKEACGNENVLTCVCKDSTAYAAYFGLFLQSRLMWVAVVTIILALLLLGGLIATCVLVCAKKKREEAMYHASEQ